MSLILTLLCTQCIIILIFRNLYGSYIFVQYLYRCTSISMCVRYLTFAITHSVSISYLFKIFCISVFKLYHICVSMPMLHSYEPNMGNWSFILLTSLLSESIIYLVILDCYNLSWKQAVFILHYISRLLVVFMLLLGISNDYFYLHLKADKLVWHSYCHAFVFFC